MIILDTSILSYLDRNPPELPAVLMRHLSNAEDVCTTVISFEEQMRGWLSYISASKQVRREVEGYARLLQLISSYRDRRVLPFDGASAVMYDDLRKRKLKLGTMDLKIASIALRFEALLVTENVADFQKIAGLRIEDWTR